MDKLNANFKKVGPLKILQLPDREPPHLSSLNSNANHSYIFQDQNTSYDKFKKQPPPGRDRHSNRRRDRNPSFPRSPRAPRRHSSLYSHGG